MIAEAFIGGWHYLYAPCDVCHQPAIVRYSLVADAWTCLGCIEKQSWFQHLSPGERCAIAQDFARAHGELIGEREAEALLDRSLYGRWAGLRAWLEHPLWS